MFLLRPMFRLVPDHTKIAFMRGRVMGLVVSAILSTASVVLFFYPGLNLGIDFSGGIVMEVRTPGPADFTQIRAALATEHIPEQGVQQFGAPSEVLIRLGAQPTEAAVQQAVTRVRTALEISDSLLSRFAKRRDRSAKFSRTDRSSSDD